MFFDFCVGETGAAGPPCGLDTIYWIWGDASYQTPRKAVTPGKTYLVFTTKGEGRVQYDGRTFRVSEGESLAMRPHRDFSYGCPGDTWRFWWFELMEPQPYLQTELVMSDAPGGFLLQLFKQSLICAKQGRWDIAQGLFLPALMLLADSRGRADAVPGRAALDRAEQYVRKNLQSASVAALCDELGLQERTLRNLCHRALGYGPKQMISRIRLETAQQLLANTTMPMRSIAAELGFSSPYHFSRSFKEHFRIPPSDYRRQSAL